MNNTTIRIGTRDSKLAVWQAEQVLNMLKKANRKAKLVKVKSPADLDLKTPLHAFQGTGIFTKMLDVALLENQIDIAVHSLKDYPTVEPEGIKMACALQRADSSDILVSTGTLPEDFDQNTYTIATGSIRRKAQWLNRYPVHKITGLRGNVQTRLKKLEDSNWAGAVFAKAGLERINLLPKHYQILDWMIPAPAQGVIGISCRSDEHDMINLLQVLNHEPSWLEASLEREFLNTAEGGCSAPIGALATISAGDVHLKAAIFEPDGSHKVMFDEYVSLANCMHFGRKAAEKTLKNGGDAIMNKINDERAKQTP